MRFEIGNHSQAPFKVFLRDGREISDQVPTPKVHENWLRRLFKFARSSLSLNKKPIFAPDGL